MKSIIISALLGAMGGSSWVAPISSLNEPVRGTAPIVVPAGEYHTFIVGDAPECRLETPGGVKAEVFVVWAKPRFVYGQWRLLAFYLPTVKQHKPTDLWAVRFKADLPPGKHKFKIRTEPGDGAPPIEYEIGVPALAIPKADIPFGMYYNYQIPVYAGPEFEDKYFRDMAEHGMNTATVYSFAAENKDQYRQFRLLQKYGMAGMPIMALGAAVPKIDGTEFLYYGNDEPAPDQRAACQVSLEAARKAGMRHVAALHPPSAWALGDLFDIWVVHASGITPSLHEHARKCRAEVWQYHCGMRGSNAKLQRYYSGVYTWAVSARGCFRWAYVHDGQSCLRQDGTWNAMMAHEYVLPTPDGPMATVGWEGAREGILDYRIITALEKKVAAQGGGNPDTTVAAMWLARLKHSVDPQLYRGTPVTDCFWDQPDFFDPGIDLDKMRAEAVDLLIR